MSDATHLRPHAPVRGWTARTLGRFHVTGSFWFRLHHFGVQIGPRWLVFTCVNLFTFGFFFALVRIRRAVWRNLEAVLGPAGFVSRNVRAYKTLHTFAWCLTERYENLVGKRPVEVESENIEAWDRLKGTGRGVIVVSAHVGNWEIGSGIPTQADGCRVNIVREEELDPEAQAFIGNLITERMGGLYVTHFATGNPRLALDLAAALDDGDVVALQVDRPRMGGKTIDVTLFGRPFRLPVGPIVLARVANAPLLPVFTLRQGRSKYKVVLRDPILVAQSDNRKADLQAAANRLALNIEDAIREAPYQWFCFGEVWPRED